MTNPRNLIFGVAYYDEYIPTAAGSDRLTKDMQMIVDAGLNTIRIAEFTWGTMEPQPGIYDFTHVDRALDAAATFGLDVIIGTPTAAIPTWMAARYPEVLGVTNAGLNKFGPRQNMDTGCS